MADPNSGVQIPGFRVLSIAGRGGMGVVYRAEQDSPRRVVALKVLHGARVEAGALRELRREAELAAGLEHPAIVPLYGYGEHQGIPYLVLRHMPGGTAADRLKSGPVPLETAVKWVTRICSALGFAHERGVVHRDVKPSNFLLDDSGNAYLTDFGIAGALESEKDSEATGSAPYMAPEQARGKSADYRADLYALAVSLFELLTGEPPYSAETALGLRARHMHDPIPSVRTRNAAVPASVDELIRWTMAKNPGHRPQSAQAFANLLEQAVRSPTSPLRPAITEPQVPTPTEREARKGGATGLWIALAVVAVVGGGALLIGAGAIGAIVLRPTPVPSARATRPATVTPPAGSPTPTGQLFDLTFDESETTPQSTPDPDGSVRQLDGTLQFQVLRSGVEWFYPSSRVSQLDVEQRLAIESVAGAARNEIGFLCRWLDPNNFVALALSTEGQASIWQARDGQISRLAGWISGPSPAAGGELAAECAGERLSLLWNDEVILETVDPDPRPGDVGLLVGMREDGELTVRVDDWRAAAR